jgi:hypothetical protein
MRRCGSLRPDVVDEIRWYFEQLRGGSPVSGARFTAARRDFGAPRCRAPNRAWTESGDRMLYAASSPVTADAIARGDGRLECEVPAHHYLHLSPWLARPECDGGNGRGNTGWSKRFPSPAGAVVAVAGDGRPGSLGADDAVCWGFGALSRSRRAAFSAAPRGRYWVEEGRSGVSDPRFFEARQPRPVPGVAHARSCSVLCGRQMGGS